MYTILVSLATIGFAFAKALLGYRDVRNNQSSLYYLTRFSWCAIEGGLYLTAGLIVFNGERANELNFAFMWAQLFVTAAVSMDVFRLLYDTLRRDENWERVTRTTCHLTTSVVVLLFLSAFTSSTNWWMMCPVIMATILISYVVCTNRETTTSASP